MKNMENNDTFIFPDTISKMFNIRARTVRDKLRHFKDMLPPDAITLAPKGRPGPQIYILKRKYLPQFCKLAQISKSFTADSNYLTATNIAHILHSHHNQIYGLLTQYQHTMPPDAIQLQKHTNKYILVLHKDFLDMFCEIAGIQKSILKTPEWLNSHKIAQQLHIRHDKIPSILNELYTQGTLPKSILQKRLCGKVTTIYLHKDYLQDFVTAAKLQTIPKKDNNWLSAKEIRQKTKRKLNNLPTMLHELRSQMPNGAIEFRKSGPKTHLCLNQEYMNDFCAITGLYIYDTKDDKNWIAAREIEEMFNTHVRQMPQLFKEMRSKLPAGAIEYKRRGPKITLYLRRDYLFEFLEKSGVYELNPKIKKMVMQQHMKHTK